MNNRTAVLALITSLSAGGVSAQDWPQWRGPNRDASAAGFEVPNTWPKELTQKWQVTVGDGVATPALAGDRLYVFSRENGNEVLRCLSAAATARSCGRTNTKLSARRGRLRVSLAHAVHPPWPVAGW